MIKNPLENYEKFSDEFALLKSRFERNGNIIDNNTIGYIQFITSERWKQTGVEALKEVNSLLFDNKSDRAYDRFISDTDIFVPWLKILRDINPEIQKSNTLNEIENSFYSFYNPILKSLEKYVQMIKNMYPKK